MTARDCVLVWGLPGDSPTDAVVDALERCGAWFLLVDQRAYPDIDVALDPGWISVRGQRVGLASMRAAFIRPQDFRRLPALEGLDRGTPVWDHAAAVEERLLAWAEITPALVVNRPSAMASNNSKPYQAAIIRAAGFATPVTLITTDPEAVRDFCREQGEVIYKSTSGVRSIVRRLDLDRDATRLDNVVHCPTQFQAYIPGHDWRVHVVGDQTFACEVVSDADDYRYAARQGRSVELAARPLDDQVASRCVALARRCGLALAGIDLRRTPDDEWYCFEVNPSPGFSYYQGETGAPIDDAIAELLGGRGSVVDFDREQP